MSEKYLCPDCSNEVESTVTCNACGDEICFDCAYTLNGQTECPACYMNITDKEQRHEELLCLNQGLELWEGFLPISKETAKQRFKMNREVYGLDYEGIEALIQEDEDFQRFEMFVISR